MIRSSLSSAVYCNMYLYIPETYMYILMYFCCQLDLAVCLLDYWYRVLYHATDRLVVYTIAYNSKKKICTVHSPERHVMHDCL